MFRLCLLLAIKHLSCLCATSQSLSHPPAFPGIPQTGPTDHLQARVWAGFSTAQFVCLFAHDTASILFIREKSSPPMTQKQFTG